MSLLSLQAEGPNKTTKDRKSKKEQKEGTIVYYLQFEREREREREREWVGSREC